MPTYSPDAVNRYCWKVQEGDFDCWLWGTLREYIAAVYPAYAKLGLFTWDSILAHLKEKG